MKAKAALDKESETIAELEKSQAKLWERQNKLSKSKRKDDQEDLQHLAEQDQMIESMKREVCCLSHLHICIASECAALSNPPSC